MKGCAKSKGMQLFQIKVTSTEYFTNFLILKFKIYKNFNLLLFISSEILWQKNVKSLQLTFIPCLNSLPCRSDFKLSGNWLSKSSPSLANFGSLISCLICVLITSPPPMSSAICRKLLQSFSQGIMVSSIALGDGNELSSVSIFVALSLNLSNKQLILLLMVPISFDAPFVFWLLLLFVFSSLTSISIVWELCKSQHFYYLSTTVSFLFRLRY